MSAGGWTAAQSFAAVAAFAGYLLLIILIGIRAARFSSAGISEFFIGGRRMSRFVVALSAVVSGRSAWLLLGVTGLAWTRGASAVWAVVGYIVVELLLFRFYAGRLRRFSERYDCVTVPDFFAERFDDRGGILRTLLVAIILLFMISYVSAQLVAGGKAFASGFGIAPVAGLLLTAAIVLAYTVLGGFLAVSVTDVVQGMFMIVALLVVPVLAIARLGGLGAMVTELSTVDPLLVDPLAISAGALVGFLAIGLGSPGNPHIVARYMSIEDPEQLRWVAVIGTVWNVMMAWGALFAGLAGRVLYPSIEMLASNDTENLYPALARDLLHPVMFGLVIASIFAAIMSTADSQLLVAGSSVVRDLYEKVVRQGVPVEQRRLVLLSRLVVGVALVVAVILGLAAESLVFWLVLFAWAGLGAALGPTSILALYWKGTTRAGVISGMVAGTVTTIVWKLTPALSSLIYELVPAFMVSAAVTWAVSLRTERPANIDTMFAAMRGERSSPVSQE